jgi:hypothetical protein
MFGHEMLGYPVYGDGELGTAGALVHQVINTFRLSYNHVRKRLANWLSRGKRVTIKIKGLQLQYHITFTM